MAAAPPALELHEAVAPLRRVGEQVAILADVVAAGVEQLKVGDEVDAVELAAAEVGCN
jgi:hypothetical protein